MLAIVISATGCHEPLTWAGCLVRAAGEGDDVEAGVICAICCGSHQSVGVQNLEVERVRTRVGQERIKKGENGMNKYSHQLSITQLFTHVTNMIVTPINSIASNSKTCPIDTYTYMP